MRLIDGQAHYLLLHLFPVMLKHVAEELGEVPDKILVKNVRFSIFAGAHNNRNGWGFKAREKVSLKPSRVSDVGLPLKDAGLRRASS